VWWGESVYVYHLQCLGVLGKRYVGPVCEDTKFCIHSDRTDSFQWSWRSYCGVSQSQCLLEQKNEHGSTDQNWLFKKSSWNQTSKIIQWKLITNNDVSTVTRLWAGQLGFDSWQGMGFFLLITTSRLTLVSTQSPIQWVSGVSSLGTKWLGHETDHSHLVPTLKMCATIPLLPNTSSWCGA